VPRGPYERHPSSPKEAALRFIVAERYKTIENHTTVDDIPSIFGFPAFIDDMKAVRFLTDGSLSIHVMIPSSFVEDIYQYIPYLTGQPMADTMERIKVTADDLTNDSRIIDIGDAGA
jgi:hypothetical protein